MDGSSSPKSAERAARRAFAHFCFGCRSASVHTRFGFEVRAGRRDPSGRGVVVSAEPGEGQVAQVGQHPRGLRHRVLDQPVLVSVEQLLVADQNCPDDLGRPRAAVHTSRRPRGSSTGRSSVAVGSRRIHDGCDRISGPARALLCADDPAAELGVRLFCTRPDVEAPVGAASRAVRGTFASRTEQIAGGLGFKTRTRCSWGTSRRPTQAERTTLPAGCDTLESEQEEVRRDGVES